MKYKKYYYIYRPQNIKDLFDILINYFGTSYIEVALDA